MDKQSESPARRTSRPDVDGTHQAALLIDFDNVTMGIRSNLGQELRNLLNSEVIRGKVAVQRAYADWRRYPQYIVPLSEASIDLIFAPAYGSSKKNATDIRLAIDALELVFVRPEIRTFILMSGDSDFSSLVLKLKEYGKYVIGVGIQESSSDLLVQNCDEYYSYSALTGLSKSGDQPAESHDPWVLVEKAVSKMVREENRINRHMNSVRRKEITEEVKDVTRQERVYRLRDYLRFDVAPIDEPRAPFSGAMLKLNSTVLRDDYGLPPEVMRRLRSVSNQEGTDPQVIADMFGYDTVKEMVTELLDAPSITDETRTLELVQSIVDGREGHMLTRCCNLGVKLLGRDVPVAALE